MAHARTLVRACVRACVCVRARVCARALAQVERLWHTRKRACVLGQVERLWRDSKLLEIGGGTNEAHHKNIARDLVRAR